MKMIFLAFAAIGALAMSASVSSERSQSPPAVVGTTFNSNANIRSTSDDAGITRDLSDDVGGAVLEHQYADHQKTFIGANDGQERFTPVLREDVNLYAIENTRSEYKTGSYEESLDASSARSVNYADLLI